MCNRITNVTNFVPNLAWQLIVTNFRKAFMNLLGRSLPFFQHSNHSINFLSCFLEKIARTELKFIRSFSMRNPLQNLTKPIYGPGNPVKEKNAHQSGRNDSDKNNQNGAGHQLGTRLSNQLFKSRTRNGVFRVQG